MLGSNPETLPKILRGRVGKMFFEKKNNAYFSKKSVELRAFDGRKKCTIRKDSLDLSGSVINPFSVKICTNLLSSGGK
jgi:hypothetical protein